MSARSFSLPGTCDEVIVQQNLASVKKKHLPTMPQPTQWATILWQQLGLSQILALLPASEQAQYGMLPEYQLGQ